MKKNNRLEVQGCIIIIFLILLVGSVSAQVLDTNLLRNISSYYPFNNSGIDVANGINLSQTGTIIYLPNGKINASLNGTNTFTDYFQINRTAHPTGNSGSINFWIYTITTGTKVIMADKDTNAQGDIYFSVDHIEFLQTASPPTLAQSSCIPLNNWTMISIVFNSTHTVFYCNGIISNVFATAKYMSDDEWNIGRDEGSVSDGLSFDEMSFWNRSLNTSEVSQLYNHGSGITYPSPPAPPATPILITTDFISPPDNFFTKNTVIEFIANISVTNSNITNATLYVYNNTGSIFASNFTTINGTLNMSNLSISNLLQGYYNWTYFVCAVNSSSTLCKIENNRTFIVDIEIPLIEYNDGTSNDGINLSINNFYINVSIIESFISNITFNLIDGNGSRLFNVSGSGTLNHNFTLLLNSLYYYNVTVCDLANNCNSTLTRRVMIDYQKPLVNIINPSTGTQTTNHNINFQWNVTDVNNRSSGVTNSLCYQETVNQSTSIDGNCILDYSGNYGGEIKTEFYDGNYSTNASTGFGLVNEFVINYTIPTNAINSSFWHIKDNGGTANISLIDFNYNCFNGTTLSFKMSAFFGFTYVSCLNNTNGVYVGLRSVVGGSSRFYEEGMYWNISTVYNYSSSGIINTTLRVYNQSGSLVNITTSSIFGNIFDFIVNLPMTLINGIYTFFASAFDYASNLGVSNNATVTIDDQSPMLNISYPTNTTYTDVVTLYQNTSSHIDWQISDLINFSACWYQIDNGTEVFVPCYLNTTNFPLNYSSHNMTFFVNDTLGNKNFTTVFALWIFMIRQNSITYEPLSTELTSQTFIYNSTLGSTVTGLSTLLNYNHTDYTSIVSSDGINTLFTNHLITPSVNVKTNFSFFWNITVGDGVTTFNTLSSRYNQTVTPITLGICNETVNQTIYNFTAYDEDTLLRIQPFYFGGEFSFSVNGSAKKTFTVTNISNEIDVCIKPANSIINVDAYVTYDENKNISQNYTARNYILQNHLKFNNTENVSLSLLNIFKSTTFILKVQDKDLVPLVNYVISTYRLNPSTSQYYLVQSGRTDNNGLTSGFLEINSVDYKFIITHDDVVELETLIPQKVIPQVAPFTLVFTISPESVNPLDNLINITNLNASFANMSNGVQFIYSDSSNNFTGARMIVYRLNYSGPNTIVCNVTSALSTSALSCNFGGVNGTYSAIGYITRNGKEFFVDGIMLIFPFGGMGWGLYGVFLGLIMILVSCFAFKFNEIAGIWLVIVSIIFVQLIGFINFGLPFISAVIAVGIIITVVMKQ